MLCFLPPVPSRRPDPGPDRNSPQAARAAQAVILIFVVLNILFVLMGLLPFVAKHGVEDRAPACHDARNEVTAVGHDLRCRLPTR